ncbi:MAG: glutamine synthetase [Deltaproteobacteria bacterium]|nr:glutamine synthetase [Deltaproteobacteria bacterium]
MKVSEVLSQLQEQNITKIKVGGFDIDGVFRGKYLSLDKFESAASSGFGFCDVIFGWDSADRMYEDGKYTGGRQGYPDLLSKIDLSTMRIHPWEPNTATFLVDFYSGDGTPFSHCPRGLLRRVVERARRLGFEPKSSVEFEFFFYAETPQSLREKHFRNLTPMTPGMFGYSVLRSAQRAALVHDIIDFMGRYNCPVEGLHTETGPGVYEVAIKYDHALAAADRAAIFKTALKVIAARHGLVATFMAKLSSDLPGCGGHIHQSLWDKEGRKNLFSDPADPNGLSRTFKHYIAGNIAMMREFAALAVPNVNSYKRLVPGTWAPTSVAWGMENRTTSLRVINGPSDTAVRMEFRLPGADVNPYLGIAASLAAGLHGIEEKLPLTQPPVSGNAYDIAGVELPLLPRSLGEAAALLEKSRVARHYFGDPFVDHYVYTRRWEIAEFQRAVTDWELARYMEII